MEKRGRGWLVVTVVLLIVAVGGCLAAIWVDGVLWQALGSALLFAVCAAGAASAGGYGGEKR